MQPTVDKVRANVEVTFNRVLKVIHSQNHLKFVHVVLMFDELATEKRVHWDLKTNYFLGLCREHAHNTAMEFTNEANMEELFQRLDDGKVHHAGEVRNHVFASTHVEAFFTSVLVTSYLFVGNCRRSGNLVQG
jgi:hypothetical protein